MSIYQDEGQDKKNTSNTQKTSKNSPENGSTFQFVDNRPELLTQKSLQAIVDKSLTFSTDSIENSASTQLSINNNLRSPAHGKYSCNEDNNTIQRAVSNSAIYAPNAASTVFINALEALLPQAELDAVAAVTQANPGVVDTPTVAAYKNNPSAKGWGCCVEEQLNPQATALGWATQYQNPNSRPDYHRNENGIDIFVDLTSILQAAGVGNHITGKLNRDWLALGSPAYWQAADITYATAPPHNGGVLAALVPNGPLDPLHTQAVQEYNQAQAGDYEEWANALYEVVGYPKHISLADFTQLWNEEHRTEFYDTMLDVQANPDNYLPNDHFS